MPDITMCANVHCPNANSCYRAKAKPDLMQCYSMFEYKVLSKGVVCEHYLPI